MCALWKSFIVHCRLPSCPVTGAAVWSTPWAQSLAGLLVGLGLGWWGWAPHRSAPPPLPSPISGILPLPAPHNPSLPLPPPPHTGPPPEKPLVHGISPPQCHELGGGGGLLGDCLLIDDIIDSGGGGGIAEGGWVPLGPWELYWIEGVALERCRRGSEGDVQLIHLCALFGVYTHNGL